jgi:hypothetical protein
MKPIFKSQSISLTQILSRAASEMIKTFYKTIVKKLTNNSKLSHYYQPLQQNKNFLICNFYFSKILNLFSNKLRSKNFSKFMRKIFLFF